MVEQKEQWQTGGRDRQRKWGDQFMKGFNERNEGRSSDRVKSETEGQKNE